MAPTLYDFTAAPSPRRARILLAEKGIAHETVQVDLMKAEQLGDAYKAINPSCTVPALKLESGTVLTENIGIAAWADAVKPEPALLGSTPEEKGLVLSWNARIEFDGFMPIAEVLRNTSKWHGRPRAAGPVPLRQMPRGARRAAPDALFRHAGRTSEGPRLRRHRPLFLRRHHGAGLRRFRQMGEARTEAGTCRSSALARCSVGTAERQGLSPC